MAAGLALGGLLLAWPGAPYWLWGGLASAAPLVTLSTANGALARLLRPAATVARARDAWPYLLAGAAAALAEIA